MGEKSPFTSVSVWLKQFFTETISDILEEDLWFR